MRIHIASSLALALLLVGCSGQAADTAPSTSPDTSAAPVSTVDESVFDDNAADIKAMGDLANGLEATTLGAVEGAEAAQTAAQELVALATERNIKDKSLSKVIDRALKKGKITLSGIKKADRDDVQAAVEKFVAAAEGLKAAPQAIADARAEFDRVEAKAEELESAISGRTEEILEGSDAKAQERAQADRDQAAKVRASINKNLEVGRGIVTDTETAATELAKAFEIELPAAKSTEDLVNDAEAEQATDEGAEAAD